MKQSPKPRIRQFMPGAVLLGFLLLVSAPSLANRPLILGVHPYLHHAEVEKRFTPLAEYLAKHLLEPVEVRVGTDYQAHLDALVQQTIDIAYLGPALYIRLEKETGRLPLLARLEADHAPTFYGHIVVRDDSPLQHLRDLKGKIFAFGDPNSTVSSLVPRAMLLQAGIKLEDLEAFKHHKGHANVALAVLSGDADAGGVKEEVFLKFKERGLRSLIRTQEIPEHLFVASPRLPASKRKRIRKLLLQLREPDAVQAVLAPIKKSATGLVPAEDRDYQPLRRLIGKLIP